MVNSNQIVVNNSSLAQQLASGKATFATINGQQVLIRTGAGNLILQQQGIKSPTPGQALVAATPTQQTSRIVQVRLSDDISNKFFLLTYRDYDVVSEETTLYVNEFFFSLSIYS